MFEKYMRERKDDFSNRGDVLFFEDSLPYIRKEGVNNIIDLGCGVGSSAKYFRDIKWTGVTYQEAEVDYFNRGNNLVGKHQCIHADMHEVSNFFADDAFDAFIMWDSLEHCISPYVALKEAWKIVRNGGIGLIFMPGANWTECKVHIHVMNVRQMKHLFNITRFKLLSWEDLKYPPENKALNADCDGMAVYVVEKDLDFNPRFNK